MNTDLIERLKRHVTPSVLQGETDYIPEKEQALAQFYPVLLSILRKNTQRVEVLGQQTNPKISELFTEKPELKQHLLEHLAPVPQAVPQDQLEQTLNRSIQPTLEYLKLEAEASHSDVIQYVIENHKEDIQRALPTWASPLLLALGASPLVDAEPISISRGESHHRTEPAIEKKQRSVLWPIIAFIIVAALIMFFFRGCTRDDDPDDIRDRQNAAQAVATEPALLRLSTGSDGQISSCQLQLNDPQYMEILQNEIKQIFNYNIGCGTENNDRYHSTFTDQDTIPSVLKTMQSVPNASLHWAGNQVSVQAANNTDAERIATEIRNLAKNMKVVTQQPIDTNAATNAAETELKKP